MNAKYDRTINKWVASCEGLEAVDASLTKAMAILFRMRTEI